MTLIKSVNSDKIHVHEVLAETKNGTESPFKSRAVLSDGLPAVVAAPSIKRILQKAIDYKSQNEVRSMRRAETEAEEIKSAHRIRFRESATRIQDQMA